MRKLWGGEPPELWGRESGAVKEIDMASLRADACERSRSASCSVDAAFVVNVSRQHLAVSFDVPHLRRDGHGTLGNDHVDE